MVKKKILLLLSFIFIIIVFLGCQTAENIIRDSGEAVSRKQSGRIINSNLLLDDQKDQLVEMSESLEIDGEIIKVSISNLEDNNKILFDDSESLKVFKEIFTNAVRLNGIVNMVAPEFIIDVVFINENEQKFYLWIGQTGEKSSLMKIDDTHTIYTVSEDMTGKLNDLIAH